MPSLSIELPPADAIAGLCRHYHVKELSIFGSAVRGELRPDSDIDLLVEFEPHTRLGLRFFVLEEELTRLFHRRVDLGEKSSLKPHVRPQALREAQVIYAA